MYRKGFDSTTTRSMLRAVKKLLKPIKHASWTFLLVAACGGTAPASGTTAAEEVETPIQEEPTEQPTEPEVPPSGMPSQSAIEMLGTGGPDKPWEDMSYEEREWYMVGKVHPVMREVFANFDPAYGEDYHCEVCHGPDGKEQKYKMPSAHLSAVPALDSEDYAAMQGSRLVTFMRDEVTVTTASLLGMEPYDPATGEGFSCHDCHPKE